MVVVYVALAVALIAAIYFLFLRPSAPSIPELNEKQSSPELKEKSSVPETATPIAAKSKEDASRAEKRTSEKTRQAPSVSELAQTKPTLGEDLEPQASTTRSDSESNVLLHSGSGASESTAQRRESEAPPSVSHVRNVEELRKGLGKARGKEGFFGKLLSIFSGKKEIDSDIASEIEEVLLSSDVGVKATESLLGRVRELLSKGELSSDEAVWAALREETLRILNVDGRAGAFKLRSKPTVVLMVGVNGAGKTTTIGKLATRMKSEGHQVVLAAADTFRAAAVQQLVVWGNRVGAEVIKGKDGADPGSVIFEAIQRAKQIGADVVLADTAGRLHTKSNLMAELTKVVKTTGKALDGAPHEILLVVDSTNGQNALAQATEFQQALPLTGVVLTKLDGTAKGGVVIGICDTLKLPVRFVGLGETANDLHDFDPEDFVEALLGREEGQS
jgi:fused signal recognition particle receptor